MRNNYTGFDPKITSQVPLFATWAKLVERAQRHDKFQGKIVESGDFPKSLLEPVATIDTSIPCPKVCPCWMRVITNEENRRNSESLLYRFPTPAGALWEQIIIEFDAMEVINVKCGNIRKRLEPEHFGMKSQKTGRPTNQWVLLKAFARLGGVIAGKDVCIMHNVIKQKHSLAHKLKQTFQIFKDPILWDKENRCYRCRFVIRAAQNALR